MTKKIYYSLIMMNLFSFHLNAEQNKSSLQLSAVKKQLEKYNCLTNDYRDNLAWNCQKNAPKGWANFYGTKYKQLSTKNNFIVKK